MNAKEYLEERSRMCKTTVNFTGCRTCGFVDNLNGECYKEWLEKNNPSEAIKIVQQWSVNNPPKTNKTVLLSNVPSHAYVVGDTSEEGWVEILFDKDWLDDEVFQ